MTEEELRAAFVEKDGHGRGLIVLPGPDQDRDPEGCIVVDGRGSSWSVYRYSHGKLEQREFASGDEAFGYAHRRYLLWDENA